MKTASVVSLFAVVAIALTGCGSSTKSTTPKMPGVTGPSSTGCPHNPVRFAVEPYDNRAALEAAYESFVSNLGAKLGCPVQLIIPRSYAAEIEAMRRGQLDVAEFGPLGYVMAHQIADAQPVAVFGDANGQLDTYTAGIWVPKSSSIKSLKQLAGKTIALSSTTSTSGGLYPISALISAGFKCTPTGCQDVSVKFASSHTAALLALTHGTADAAEVNSQQQGATAAHEFNAADYREIWKSTPIINDVITVYGHLSAVFQAKVKSALLGLSAVQLATVDKELGTASNGPMVAASDSLYNQVRAVANTVHLTPADL